MPKNRGLAPENRALGKPVPSPAYHGFPPHGMVSSEQPAQGREGERCRLPTPSQHQLMQKYGGSTRYTPAISALRSWDPRVPWEMGPLSRPKLSLFSFQQLPCSALNNCPECPSATGRELGGCVGPQGCGVPRARGSGSSKSGLGLQHWKLDQSLLLSSPKPTLSHPKCKLLGRISLDGRGSLRGLGRGTKSEQEASPTQRLSSLLSPSSHPSPQKEADLGAAHLG